VPWDTPGGDLLGACSASGTVWCVEEEHHEFDVTSPVVASVTNPNTYAGLLLSTLDTHGADPYYMSADNALYDTNQQPYLVVVFDNGEPAWEEAPFQAFAIRLSNDWTTTLLSWTNFVPADIYACTNLEYTAAADAWYLRATGVSCHWTDVAASNHPSVYYRLVSRPLGTYTSTYDVGKYTVPVLPSESGLPRQNWLSCPFALIDAYGNTISMKSFDEMMLEMCLTAEGPAIRRDAVQSQPSIGDDPKQATYSTAGWAANDPTATNWYWNKMYRLVINTVHTGTLARFTFVGKVRGEDEVHVGLVQKSINELKRQNWVAYPYARRSTFEHAGLSDVLTPAGPAILRDAVQSQVTIGGNPQQATLALTGWVTTDSSATNCIPGKGYSVIINTNHVGTAVEWVCPRPPDN
jgi:hypothetical protein